HYPIIAKQLFSPEETVKGEITRKVGEILGRSSNINIDGIDPDCSFLEMGFDSLMLTQVAFTLKKEFDLPITFRQLMEEYSTVDELTDYLIAHLPQTSLEEYRAINAAEAPAPSITLLRTIQLGLKPIKAITDNISNKL